MLLIHSKESRERLYHLRGMYFPPQIEVLEGVLAELYHRRSLIRANNYKLHSLTERFVLHTKTVGSLHGTRFVR